ncbi:MAG: transposase, partial [Balneolaceae bacterium]|nr:transposase [Balneolaceae bacterium]
VTSLHPAQIDAQMLYEQVYCARGEAENRIKEQQLYLFADRTSCSAMAANQLRLWFSAVAYWLLCELRRVGLKATEWARAQCHTIRNNLLKIGGLVRVSVRRVRVALASGYPWKSTFRQIAGNIRRAWEPS